jgi:hypothetical protein
MLFLLCDFFLQIAEPTEEPDKNESKKEEKKEETPIKARGLISDDSDDDDDVRILLSI